jgi:hypothetical protein
VACLRAGERDEIGKRVTSVVWKAFFTRYRSAQSA